MRGQITLDKKFTNSNAGKMRTFSAMSSGDESLGGTALVANGGAGERYCDEIGMGIGNAVTSHQTVKFSDDVKTMNSPCA